jgi:hypothetical protein
MPIRHVLLSRTAALAELLLLLMPGKSGQNRQDPASAACLSVNTKC